MGKDFGFCPRHTACIGFLKAKKLAASILAFQTFEGFIGT